MVTNISDFYMGVQDGSPNMVMALDKNYIVVLANGRFNNFSKDIFEKTELTGMDFNKITSKENPTIYVDMMECFSKALNDKSKTIIFKVLNGKLIGLYFEMAFYPIKNSDLQIIGTGCVAKNVTDRESLIVSLRSSKNIFSLASKLAHLAPWEFDVKNNVFIFNDEIYALYGTSVEKEGITMSPEVFAKKIIYPEEASTVQQFFEKMFKSRDLESTIDFESRIVRLDNKKIRVIKVLVKIIRNESGNILEFYGTNQDVTEQVETQNILNEKLIELEKFNKLFVDREVKMIELKQEIERLKQKS